MVRLLRFLGVFVSAVVLSGLINAATEYGPGRVGEIGVETWGQVMKGYEYKYGYGHPWKICKLVYSMG